ncbi:MAG: CotH kinase family protein, partial [Planctomycetes bacterium]|nr:CotH kinase family protein [Planctomycetota bacterium]
LNSRRRLSNDPLDGSFVFGGSTIYYEAQTRFSGSPWARAGWGGSFRVRMPRDEPLHGRIRRFGLEDNQGNPVDARTRISHYLIRQQNGGGVPVPYTEGFVLVRWQVNDATSGVREHNWVPDGDFISLWFPGDDEGDFLEMDDRFLIDDNGNRASSADGRVLYPPPYGSNDSSGDNKENYRWFFNLRAKGGADEYANFMAFAKVLDPARTSDALFDQQIGDFAEVEELLRLWAVEMNVDDWDAWGQSRGKNCYFYRPEATGLWHKFSWDLELTYGNVNSFIIPSSPTDTFNPGGFGEVNRMMNRPKIKRMYYGILDEMVNGANRWFHSDFLSDYAGKLAALGMAQTGIAQPGGYIDQRAALLETRIRSVVYPQVRLAITTNSGANFSTSAASVTIAGTAPVEVCQILVTNDGDEGTLYLPAYTSMTAWSIAGIPVTPGANALVFFGLDLRGGVIDSDSITVTSTASWNAPSITSLNPASSLAGTDIEVLGTDFHNGLKVSFGAVQSPVIVFDENGATPGKIVARVPAGSGTVSVTVRNTDNKTSNARAFTYTVPPSSFVRGDANGDASVDLSDAVRIVLHLFAGKAADCEDALDVDDNELLNVTDAVGLLNYLFKSGAAPRAPFPAEGTDPSGTGLGCQR